LGKIFVGKKDRYRSYSGENIINFHHQFSPVPFVWDIEYLLITIGGKRTMDVQECNNDACIAEKQFLRVALEEEIELFANMKQRVSELEVSVHSQNNQLASIERKMGFCHKKIAIIQCE
jgi:hypothetical protein